MMQTRTFNEWYKDGASKRIADAGWQGIEVRDVRWQLLNAYRSGSEAEAGKVLTRLIEEKTRTGAGAIQSARDIQDLRTGRRNRD